jgi:hypothetical protein
MVCLMLPCSAILSWKKERSLYRFCISHFMSM